jgi:hypothetical protein
MACEGLRTACRGRPLMRAFLIWSEDRLRWMVSASFSMDWTVSCWLMEEGENALISV